MSEARTANPLFWFNLYSRKQISFRVKSYISFTSYPQIVGRILTVPSLSIIYSNYTWILFNNGHVKPESSDVELIRFDSIHSISILQLTQPRIRFCNFKHCTGTRHMPPTVRTGTDKNLIGIRTKEDLLDCV